MNMAGNGLKYAMFVGCTAPARNINYEAATRKIAEKLGIELVDINDFGCCGFPAIKISHDAAISIAARNLAIAEEKGLDIITICTACSGNLAKANMIFKEGGEEAKHINKALKEIGKKYKGTVNIYHLGRVLYEKVGIDKIKELITKPLTGLRCAPHEGCHYVAPSEIFEGFDDPIWPVSLNRLIEATGAEAIGYKNQRQCCGGDLLAVDESVSVDLVKEKMDHIKEAKADAMVVQCPFCDIMYDEYQPAVEKKFEQEYKLPVLFLPQLLGMAMGFTQKDLGLKMNRVKTKALCEKFDIPKK
jgi:heterodisulfide reductase subunit B